MAQALSPLTTSPVTDPPFQLPSMSVADWTCTSCGQETVSKVKLTCGHFFHRACILPWIQAGKGCPLCRRSVSLLSLAHSLEDNDPTNPIELADTLFPKTLVLNHIRHALNHHFPNSSSAQGLPKDPSEHSVCIALKILFPHQQEIQTLPYAPSVDQLVKALQNALPEDPRIQSIPATYVLALMKSTLLAHFKAKGVKEADIDDALKTSSYPSAQDLVRILNSHFSVSDLPADPAFLCQAFETIFPNFFSIIPSETSCAICLDALDNQENPRFSGVIASKDGSEMRHIECADSLWNYSTYPVSAHGTTLSEEIPPSEEATPSFGEWLLGCAILIALIFFLGWSLTTHPHLTFFLLIVFLSC